VRGLVLDMMVPTLGKKLRFRLGREVGALGEGFRRIADEVGPDQMVGEVLAHREAHKLLYSK
jgi:hypothetical protein